MQPFVRYEHCTLKADLQTDVGVFHTLLSQAGEGEVLAVLFKIDLARCSGLGSAGLVNTRIKNKAN